MWVWFCFVSVIVVVLVRDDSAAHTWATKREPHRPNPITDVEEGFVLFVIICSSFVFRPPFFFVSRLLVRLVWAGNLSRSLYLFFIVLFFVFSRKNGVRFFVCFAFCLLLLLFQSIFKLLIIIFNFTYFLLLLLFVFN